MFSHLLIRGNWGIDDNDYSVNIFVLPQIQSVSLVGRAGLGSSQSDTSAIPPNLKKRKRLNITKQRFIQASKDT